jgi:hypothetical protein
MRAQHTRRWWRPCSGRHWVQFYRARGPAARPAAAARACMRGRLRSGARCGAWPSRRRAVTAALPAAPFCTEQVCTRKPVLGVACTCIHMYSLRDSARMHMKHVCARPEQPNLASQGTPAAGATQAVKEVQSARAAVQQGEAVARARRRRQSPMRCAACSRTARASHACCDGYGQQRHDRRARRHGRGSGFARGRGRPYKVRAMCQRANQPHALAVRVRSAANRRALARSGAGRRRCLGRRALVVGGALRRALGRGRAGRRRRRRGAARRLRGRLRDAPQRAGARGQPRRGAAGATSRLEAGRRRRLDREAVQGGRAQRGVLALQQPLLLVLACVRTLRRQERGPPLLERRCV